MYSNYQSYSMPSSSFSYSSPTMSSSSSMPISMSSEDDVFRVGEYTINSAPDTGEAPYEISYMPELPEVQAGD